MILHALKKTPLYPMFQHARHWVHTHVTRRANPALRQAILNRYSTDQQSDFALLEKTGFLSLPGYFSGDTLRDMQAEFKAVMESPYTGYDPELHLHQCTNGDALSLAPTLARFMKDPYLKDLATYYWGQPISLLTSWGYRIHPMPPKEFSSFQWHHDCKNKQLKVFVLLTDLTEDDQIMEFLPETHTWIHVFTTYQESRFTKEQVQGLGAPLKTIGKAGTVFLFDTNGLHKGVRNLSRIRDLWVNLPIPVSFPQKVKQNMSIYTENSVELPL